MACPCETRTSTCRSFATISSGLYRFLAIAVLLDVKDIPQVGPLQWGRITILHVQNVTRRSFNHIQGSAHTRECAHASLWTARAARRTGRANSAPRGKLCGI